MQYRVVNTFFIPGAVSVTIAVKPLEGPFAAAGAVLDLFTTDQRLRSHLPDPAVGEWGDAEVLAEARAQLLAKGDPDPVVLPYEPPVPPAPAVSESAPEP